MKQTVKAMILIIPILMAIKTFGQHENQLNMERNSSEGSPVIEQVVVIDEISIPEKSISAYSEKSLFIRNILRQQPGFVRYEIFQRTGDTGDLRVITVATWAGRKHLDGARLVMQETMEKIGLHMPAFLKQHGITMERGVYQAVEE